METRENNEAINSFDVHHNEKAKWITIFDTPYYPDFLAEREALHKPTLIEFRKLVEQADSSDNLLRMIMMQPLPLRVQLCRLFNKYVSPDTSVEMLKRVRKTEENISNFGFRFRDISTVKERLFSRPEDDQSLFAILGEYDLRGQKGYNLTSLFFDWFNASFEGELFTIHGPVGAGSDLILSRELPDYPHATPADFVIRYDGHPVCVGFARYDSDRGGAQEDDRTKGNERHATQVLAYVTPEGQRPLKVLFLNDGPGLLLGSMWSDYVRLESLQPQRVAVCTLLMLEHRVTRQWLLGL